MNIFVAGVHGVGKTYLASQLPASLGLMHTSASKLIKHERALPGWAIDKRVSDVEANQAALAAAVTRYNKAGTRLILDGHFVLLNPQGEFSRLGTEVFKALSLEGVILIEADAHTIAIRIRERDGRDADVDHIARFIAEERSQAQLVCNELEIPLLILEAPNPDTFEKGITAVALRAKGR